MRSFLKSLQDIFFVHPNISAFTIVTFHWIQIQSKITRRLKTFVNSIAITLKLKYVFHVTSLSLKLLYRFRFIHEIEVPYEGNDKIKW